MKSHPPAAGARSEGEVPPLLTVDHLPLDDAEVRLEAMHFLSVFTAAWLVFICPLAGRVAYYVPAAPAEQLPKIALLVVIAAALVACLWGIRSATGSRGAFAASVLLAVLVVAKNLWVIANDVMHGREPTGWSIPSASIGFVYIACQVLRIGWIARRTPASELAAVATFPETRARVAAICLQAIGVPPIWPWLTSRWRKACALLLFALSMVVFSNVVFLLMGELTTSPLTIEQYVTESQSCIRLRGYADGCAEHYWWDVAVYVAIETGFDALAFTIVGGLRYAARRFATSSLEKILSKDRRPTTLFLRSFRDDQVRLARPRRQLLFRIVAFGEPRPTLDHVLLEEATPSGPVVAIGAPGSRPPFGAARTYVTDDQWQDVVRELARDAGRIVIALDETEGVSWELKTLFSAEHFTKVLFLLPPRLTAPHDVQRLVSQAFVASAAMQGVANTVDAAVSNTQRACIGWYLGDDGVLHLMTTTRPSHLSYVLAVRFFLQAHGRAR